MKRGLSIALCILAAVALGATVFGPNLFDRSANQVVGAPPPPSDAAWALYRTLRVVDLHADPLLWSRDLLDRADHGHVDVPRLIQGGVALQVFGIVTGAPIGQNYQRTSDDGIDGITLLAVLQRWPPRTWTSRLARSEHLSARFFDAAERSDGALRGIRTAADLEDALAAGAAGAPQVAGLLGLEGMHGIGDDLAGVDTLFAAGVRMMAPTHFFDNLVGGSASGVEKGGLTSFGRDAIRRASELGIVIDLAHASPATIVDVLDQVTKPVVVSHTGVKATCPGPRTLSDGELRRIASGGGVVGIGYWAGAVCGTQPADIARAMAHVRSVVGAEHIALGSDFDGGVTTAFDTTGLASLVDALFAAGFGEDEIRGVMGENALRVLLATLPQGER